MPESREVLERVFREEAGVVQGALFAQLRDLDLVEDAFQDAVAAALEHWPREGVPRRPGAWLFTAARRKALDRLRRRATRLDKQEALALEQELAGAVESNAEDEEIPDERLRLIVTCCHPELARQAQVALTLRTLGGLSTAEIARAFLVDESAMARRLVRAKARLREAGVAYQVPPLEQLPERREAVLAVLYLIFNEGYAATAGDALVRRELCAEAIRLARVLAELVPGDTEVRGLWALMLLHDARRDARVGPDGVAITLEEQDRANWDRAQIDAGLALLAGLGTWHRAGAYELQARIGALHVSGASFSDTDWRSIVDLYDRLLELAPSPVVALNRAIAVGLADGAESGLALLDAPELARELADYAPYGSARADLLRRAGRTAEARIAYREAIERAGTTPERAFLEKRLEALSPVKLALVLVAAALFGFVAITWLALEAGGVAIVKTRAADGSLRATHVWFAESDGELWLEAGSPENPWFVDLGRDPRLELRAEGRDGAYLAERRDDAESRARVRARLTEKYGWRDAWVGLFIDQSRSLVVRLVPAS